MGIKTIMSDATRFSGALLNLYNLQVQNAQYQQSSSEKVLVQSNSSEQAYWTLKQQLFQYLKGYLNKSVRVIARNPSKPKYYFKLTENTLRVVSQKGADKEEWAISFKDQQIQHNQQTVSMQSLDQLSDLFLEISSTLDSTDYQLLVSR